MLRDFAALTLALIELGQEAHAPHPPTRLPDESRFLKDIKVLLDNRTARAAPEAAVLVIDAATPNEYAELVHTLGRPAADSFEVATAIGLANPCLNKPDSITSRPRGSASSWLAKLRRFSRDWPTRYNGR